MPRNAAVETAGVAGALLQRGVGEADAIRPRQKIVRVQTKTAEQLRQSSDRGLTWKTLFTTTSVLEQLTLTSNPSLRYYVISNKNTLLRGSFGQQVPDTVLTLERKPIQWPTNIASIHLFISTFDYIYLSAPDIGLYWSCLLYTSPSPRD